MVARKATSFPAVFFGRTTAPASRAVLFLFLQTGSSRIDHQAPAFDVDFQHGGLGKGNEHRSLAGTFEFQKVACAKIEDARYRAMAAALGIDSLQSFEIGIEELVFVELLVRQVVALDVEVDAVQLFGGIPPSSADAFGGGPAHR